ncbi:putative metal ion transporter C17A12.14 [Schizosaccharomyces pombe]|uniref:Putative metal ion transporter C17A12.14 n=1 Tax=Schizosaccharomyces pombe (strain 972 / ATCC 24843) TaxID=284812 RepID=YF2E_SCHPO|nr:CorA family magnesium ion transporter [Schizosaccharomyces pombe]O13779.4 RecName: Full=Putative metal ion transporter C17A12.14 [Schizosaccharomyces pombe 972h-]CAB16566.2 CorA family magnesium ion transporter [Schizosaccharomyces pombe]|eukprot:NP_001342869.1 CorA family magnesium ion transporter [Schizosaccharomyces pombe]
MPSNTSRSVPTGFYYKQNARMQNRPRFSDRKHSSKSKHRFPVDPSLQPDEADEGTRLLGNSDSDLLEPPSEHSSNGEDDKDINNPPSMPSSVCSSPKSPHRHYESDEDIENISLPESHPEDIQRKEFETENGKNTRDQPSPLAEVSDFAISSPHVYPKSANSHDSHYEQFANNDVTESAVDDHPATRKLSRDELYLPISPNNAQEPKFSVLDEWTKKMVANFEEYSVEDVDKRRERNRKLSEPLLVNGRYRVRDRWAQFRKSEIEKPYRFTFFTDELPSTIHSHEMWELVHDGQSFEDLFHSGGTWWLDVSCPKEEEIRVLAKAFGIHPLTVEDITLEEDREKVELFRTYYFVTFRSFNQLPSNSEYLKPLNFYLVVFRDGIITFHMNPTPHPANVRRRIRQLNGYLTVNADWIAYALLDDTTDAFAPFIEQIEDEVDTIDSMILSIHYDHVMEVKPQERMLQRVGECRKLIMSLLRLLANKADVVRGLSKRCNESWQVAPRGEIALYLGDVQDHIVTMVQNLNHYEKILSRSHSNYLAQISINMTLVSNETNEVLSRLTILGTILIPLNLVTGLWGMNVKVPGQDVPGLGWFFSILGSLMIFAISSFILCKWYKVI